MTLEEYISKNDDYFYQLGKEKTKDSFVNKIRPFTDNAILPIITTGLGVAANRFYNMSYINAYWPMQLINALSILPTAISEKQAINEGSKIAKRQISGPDYLSNESIRKLFLPSLTYSTAVNLLPSY